MLELKTANANARIFKAHPAPELQVWEITNPTAGERWRIKAPHFHDECQIGFLSEGILENCYRKKKEIIHPYQLYIIQPGEVHGEQLVGGKKLRFSFAFLAKELLVQAAQELTDGKSLEIAFPALLVGNSVRNDHLLNKTAAVFSTLQHPSIPLERECRLLDWMTDILRCQGLPVEAVRRVGREPKAVRVVKQCLQEDYARRLSLDFLSEVACLSKYHLLRTFVKETGMTIHQYQTHLRICEAKLLLRKGDRITQVALQLGFTDQAHFSHCFKRFTSQTPNQF